MESNFIPESFFFSLDAYVEFSKLLNLKPSFGGKFLGSEAKKYELERIKSKCKLLSERAKYLQNNQITVKKMSPEELQQYLHWPDEHTIAILKKLKSRNSKRSSILDMFGNVLEAI